MAGSLQPVVSIYFFKLSERSVSHVLDDHCRVTIFDFKQQRPVQEINLQADGPVTACIWAHVDSGSGSMKLLIVGSASGRIQAFKYDAQVWNISLYFILSFSNSYLSPRPGHLSISSTLKATMTLSGILLSMKEGVYWHPQEAILKSGPLVRVHSLSGAIFIDWSPAESENFFSRLSPSPPSRGIGYKCTSVNFTYSGDVLATFAESHSVWV